MLLTQPAAPESPLGPRLIVPTPDRRDRDCATGSPSRSRCRPPAAHKTNRQLMKSLSFAAAGRTTYLAEESADTADHLVRSTDGALNLPSFLSFPFVPFVSSPRNILQKATPRLRPDGRTDYGRTEALSISRQIAVSDKGLLSMGADANPNDIKRAACGACAYFVASQSWGQMKSQV